MPHDNRNQSLKPPPPILPSSPNFLGYSIPQTNKYLHTSLKNDNNSKNFISSKTHRSQLLYRLVQCLLRHAYDYGIIVSSYLPITLAENRTYSGSLQTDNQMCFLQLGKSCNKRRHNNKAPGVC